MRIYRILISTLCIMFLAAAVAGAQEKPYDGLTPLAQSHVFTDDTGGTLTVTSFHTRYQEAVVGFYFKQGKHEVRFYANAATWSKVKQILVDARDKWQTLSPTEFVVLHSVQSYRIANKLSVMRLSLQGATTLQTKQLFLSATGGPNTPQRVSVHFNRQTLRDLIDVFYGVDAELSKKGPAQ